MTECRSPEVQDLLPDFLAESLGDADRIRVTTHLADCDACTADLAVLRQVRAVRAVGVSSTIDIAAVVAALPRPPRVRVTSEPRPALRLHAADARPSRAASRSVFRGASLWRLAAAVGVLLAGGMSVIVARQGQRGLLAPTDALQVSARTDSTTSPSRTDRSATVVASVEPGNRVGDSAVDAAAAVNATRAPQTRANVAVSFGGLDDPTEEELRQLLDRLEKWDGATSTEPVSTVPLVTTRGGTTP